MNATTMSSPRRAAFGPSTTVALFLPRLEFASPTERNTNKGIDAMGFLNLNADRKVHTPIHCRMCGSTIERGIPRPLESICLICRAAILDRMFRTRGRGPMHFRPSVR